MTSFRVNTVIWDDEAFVGLSDLARTLLFLVITGPQATVLPGLQRGSVATLADTLRRPAPDVEDALASLVALGIVELDAKRRVLRAPNAPKHNPADSPNHIRAWWNRWQEIPDCALKYRHVAALRAHAQFHQKGHASAWEATFGTVPAHLFVEFGADEPPPLPSGSPPAAPTLPTATPAPAPAEAAPSPSEGLPKGSDGPAEVLAKDSGSGPEAPPKPSASPSEAALASASASALASASASRAGARERPPPDPRVGTPGYLAPDTVFEALLRGAVDALETGAAATLAASFVAIVNDHEATVAELEAVGREIREHPPKWVESGRMNLIMLLGKNRDGANFTSLLGAARARTRAGPGASRAFLAEVSTPATPRVRPEVRRAAEANRGR
jgi:hypothetical protein